MGKLRSKQTFNRPNVIPSGKSKISAFQKFKQLSNTEARNLIRGLVAKRRSVPVSSEVLNPLRQSESLKDIAIGSEIILGREGLFPFPNIGGNNDKLLKQHGLNSVSSESEAAFVAGHLNGWSEEVRAITAALGEFVRFPTTSAVDAMTALATFTDRYGASSYVARKCAYVMAQHGKTTETQDLFQRIANRVDQSKAKTPYFAALELIDTDLPYFSSVSTRLQVFSKHVRNDFRQILTLHDVVPVSISVQDIAAFLRKSHSCSLVDEVAAVLCILNLRENWEPIAALFEMLLDSGIKSAFSDFSEKKFDATALYSDVSSDEADFAFYRRALAFIEFAPCSKYRLFVDRTLAPRLLPNLIGFPPADVSDSIVSKSDLSREFEGFHDPNDYDSAANFGVFLRTVQFLKYLNHHKTTFSFSSFEIRTIFENTTSLDNLMTVQEIEYLYARVDDDVRPLMTVLALALYKVRNRDGDVDFKFRAALSATIVSQFDSRIEAFLEWLLPETPQVAVYLLHILDRQTLQKLYWLIKSADEADAARQALLRVVGKSRNEIQYFVEADSIEAQRQVAKLRKYFDDSRIYVDGIAMTKWLIANPNAYVQQYMQIVEHNIDVVAARLMSMEHGILFFTGSSEVSALTAFDYILEEIAQIAFKEFCTSREFGIESYLGRRIRHNTLTGMLRGGVEDIFELPKYHALRFSSAFVAANGQWIKSYRALIEVMRKEVLQFRGESQSKALFSSDLRKDENTKIAIATLRNVLLAARNSEIFNELLIRFCWQEINPQLISAAKFITVDLMRDAYDLLDTHLHGFDEDLQREYLLEVREAVHERFTRLGSWFRQPDDGFVSASIRQLVGLITVEADDGLQPRNRDLEWCGDASDLMLDGLSVHRMYDCLFVLLTNAFRYGSEDAPVIIDSVQIGLSSETLARVQVSVTSTFSPTSDRSNHIRRLEDSFSNKDVGNAMVLEGYTGIRKLRYISQNSESRSTASFTVDGDKCTLIFWLTVELASVEEAPL